MRVRGWTLYGFAKTFDELGKMGVRAVICLDDKRQHPDRPNNRTSPSEKPYGVFTAEERERLKPVLGKFESYLHLATRDPVD